MLHRVKSEDTSFYFFMFFWTSAMSSYRIWLVLNSGWTQSAQVMQCIYIMYSTELKAFPWSIKITLVLTATKPETFKTSWLRGTCYFSSFLPHNTPEWYESQRSSPPWMWVWKPKQCRQVKHASFSSNPLDPILWVTKWLTVLLHFGWTWPFSKPPGKTCSTFSAHTGGNFMKGLE